ncbi:DNA (cytosine-5)-methyltransferase 1 [Xylophilus ampelinus]|uniref:DNA (Cytosine-5)-methyltransferase 1 n=1 Tax=Xylophilus ampelinus TaxID=54067 RepID=A0A318SQM0_9BURK|nr:DNA (cytosine-5)-methyltransferase 1 [Xylophilus ampelinus]
MLFGFWTLRMNLGNPYVALPTVNALELCAGVGMLGEGVRAGFEFLGIHHRTVCYVEREAAAAAQLATLMEAGALDQAPVWSDMLTFDGAAWRGCVDLVVAGFPCQDLSVAGRRAGLGGKRSGLFFRVLDIADDCGADELILENVAGIATATASVVDEAEGALEERAVARVLGELADRGWDAEWLPLSASDVGANHGRLRWFCYAWRVADTGHGARADQPISVGWRGRAADHCAGGQALEYAGHGTPWNGTAGAGASAPLGGRLGRPASTDRGGLLVNAESIGRREGWPEYAGQQGRPAAAEPVGAVDDAQRLEQPGQRIHAGPWPSGGGAADADGPGPALANASQPRLPHPEQPREPGESQPLGRGAIAELRGAPLFAPGPADPVWADLVSASRVGSWQRAVADDEAGACPWAPATKPGVRMLADGLAIVVDESRAHQLRQIGNGVVPLCAAAAVVVVLQRAGVNA